MHWPRSYHAGLIIGERFETSTGPFGQDSLTLSMSTLETNCTWISTIIREREATNITIKSNLTNKIILFWIYQNIRTSSYLTTSLVGTRFRFSWNPSDREHLALLAVISIEINQ